MSARASQRDTKPKAAAMLPARRKRGSAAATALPAIGLEDVLAYRNDQVVSRFLKLYDVPREEAEDLFAELRKFLWACSRTSHTLEPTLILDEMWHNFILFTGDYARFCRDYCGYFVHHNPTDKDAERKKPGFRERAATQFREQCEILYELLGESTLVTWYITHPGRYDEVFFRSKTRLPKPRVPRISARLACHLAASARGHT